MNIKKRILLSLNIILFSNIIICDDPFVSLINSPQTTQKIYQTLCDMHDFFTLYKIIYLIDWGTLLGAVRHSGLIPWDNDLDLSIFEKDEKKLVELFPILKSIGYEIVGMPFGYKIYHNEGAPIEGRPWTCPGCDIFILASDEQKAFYKHRFSKEQIKNIEINLNDIFPLRTYFFGPLLVMGPRNPTPWLMQWYGENYLTIGYIDYDHSTEKKVKKTIKLLESADYLPAKPTQQLKHRILETKIKNWPVDFYEEYPIAKL